MTNKTDIAALRAQVSNPAVGSKDHLRKFCLMLLDELEAERQRADELKGILNIERGISAFESRRTAYIDGMRDKWQARAEKAESELAALKSEHIPVYQMKSSEGIVTHWIDLSEAGYQQYKNTHNVRVLYTAPQKLVAALKGELIGLEGAM